MILIFAVFFKNYLELLSSTGRYVHKSGKMGREKTASGLFEWNNA